MKLIIALFTTLALALTGGLYFLLRGKDKKQSDIETIKDKVTQGYNTVLRPFRAAKLYVVTKAERFQPKAA